MDKVGGPLGLTAIAVVAALVILLAILHFGFHVFRRRKGRSRGKSDVLSDSRVEVLESTVIDEERRLVLIRCDRIEHLIMVGGPVDLVVENDVRKVRGPGAPPTKIPGIEPEKRAAAVQRPAPAAMAAPEPTVAAPRVAEPHRAAPRPPADPRQAAAARSIPAIQPPAGRGTPRSAETLAPPMPRAEETARAGQRPQPVDPKSTRRDAAPPRRATQTLPAPVSRASEPIRAASGANANDRNARPAKAGGRSEPSPALPAAQIPWSDPDSIENEIVRALRFDPKTRGEQAGGRREPPSPKALTDSHTTLGDLADRLEEALAREVQSARQPEQTPVADEFGFDTETTPPESERAKPAPQKDRPEKRERSEPGRASLAPAPEAEPRREQPAPAERREEAPVISLNSRRRESADQLEDEMARLLGELTSDTKGR